MILIQARPDFLSLMLKTQESSSESAEVVHHEELISGEEATAEGAHWKIGKHVGMQ